MFAQKYLGYHKSVASYQPATCLWLTCLELDSQYISGCHNYIASLHSSLSVLCCLLASPALLKSSVVNLVENTILDEKVIPTSVSSELLSTAKDPIPSHIVGIFYLWFFLIVLGNFQNMSKRILNQLLFLCAITLYYRIDIEMYCFWIIKCFQRLQVEKYKYMMRTKWAIIQFRTNVLPWKYSRVISQ